MSYQQLIVAWHGSPVGNRVASANGVHGCERFHVQNFKSHPLMRGSSR